MAERGKFETTGQLRCFVRYLPATGLVPDVSALMRRAIQFRSHPRGPLHGRRRIDFFVSDTGADDGEGDRMAAQCRGSSGAVESHCLSQAAIAAIQRTTFRPTKKVSPGPRQFPYLQLTNEHFERAIGPSPDAAAAPGAAAAQSGQPAGDAQTATQCAAESGAVDAQSGADAVHFPVHFPVQQPSATGSNQTQKPLTESGVMRRVASCREPLLYTKV